MRKSKNNFSNVMKKANHSIGNIQIDLLVLIRFTEALETKVPGVFCILPARDYKTPQAIGSLWNLIPF